MSEQEQAGTSYNDGLADAICATIIISLAVATVVFWLSGQ